MHHQLGQLGVSRRGAEFAACGVVADPRVAVIHDHPRLARDGGRAPDPQAKSWRQGAPDRDTDRCAELRLVLLSPLAAAKSRLAP
jgi:hypothetical protein